MALTNEQKEQKMQELRIFIAEHKDTKGPLMPIMQKAQVIFLSKPRALLPTPLTFPCRRFTAWPPFTLSFPLNPRAKIS